MKRRTLSDDTDDSGPVGAPDAPRFLPCRWCGASTAVATLANYGARCFACYEAYRREPQTHVDIGDKRVDRLGWAKALQRRHAHPNHGLTPPQIAMYKAALERLHIDDAPPSTEDSRRLDKAKREASARVAQYLRDPPELADMVSP